MNDAYYDMPFCPDYLYDELGNLVGVSDDADLAALPDFEVDLDGKQYACLDYPRDVEIGPEFATVHDSVLLIGDARMRL